MHGLGLAIGPYIVSIISDIYIYIYTGVKVDGSIRPREDGTVPAYICTPRRRGCSEKWDELFTVSSAT